MQNKNSHALSKTRDLPMRLGERYGEVEYRGDTGTVIQRWCGSTSGNVNSVISSTNELLVQYVDQVGLNLGTERIAPRPTYYHKCRLPLNFPL